MEKTVFEIKTPAFQGPFDLLLFFIEQKELDIHTVSLAGITNDFLAYIQRLQELNMELASEFIYVAATLIRIKVKTLIPKPVVETEEPEEDLQKELLRRLLLYKQFKEASSALQALEEERSKWYLRGNIDEDVSLALDPGVSKEELASLDLFKLLRTYDRLSRAYENEKAEVKHTVVLYPYTIEEQKKALAAWIDINNRLDFFFLLEKSDNRVHFVYNFLAILEMIQQQLVQLEEGKDFNDFSIRRREIK